MNNAIDVLSAINESIHKWQQIMDMKIPDMGADNCPLCKIFNLNYDLDCGYCPIKNYLEDVDSGNNPYYSSCKYYYSGCKHTPYAEFRQAAIADGERIGFKYYRSGMVIGLKSWTKAREEREFIKTVRDWFIKKHNITIK